MRHRSLLACLPSLCLVSCILSENPEPTVAVGLSAATDRVHRGMVLNDNEVAAADVSIEMEAWNSALLTFQFESWMDLRNSTGSAWFPDNQGGEFSEIDLTLRYDDSYSIFNYTLGVVSYVLPKGEVFPISPRTSTNELFATVQTQVKEVFPFFQIHGDFDEADGLYFDFGVASKSYIVADKVVVNGNISLGYATKNQSDWMYGIKESGFSDLGIEVRGNYEYDERTNLFASIRYSSIWDDDLRDWFDVIGIDNDKLLFEIGVAWNL